MRRRITEIGDPWGMTLLSGKKLERLLPDFMIIFLFVIKLRYFPFLQLVNYGVDAYFIKCLVEIKRDQCDVFLEGKGSCCYVVYLE